MRESREILSGVPIYKRLLLLCHGIEYRLLVSVVVTQVRASLCLAIAADEDVVGDTVDPEMGAYCRNLFVGHTIMKATYFRNFVKICGYGR